MKATIQPDSRPSEASLWAQGGLGPSEPPESSLGLSERLSHLMLLLACWIVAGLVAGLVMVVW